MALVVDGYEDSSKCVYLVGGQQFSSVMCHRSRLEGDTCHLFPLKVVTSTFSGHGGLLPLGLLAAALRGCLALSAAAGAFQGGQVPLGSGAAGWDEEGTAARRGTSVLDMLGGGRCLGSIVMC